MVLITSVYSIVDGFFVSNFAGKTGFAAVNLTMPVIMLVGSLGLMIGTGGAALTSSPSSSPSSSAPSSSPATPRNWCVNDNRCLPI